MKWTKIFRLVDDERQNGEKIKQNQIKRKKKRQKQ